MSRFLAWRSLTMAFREVDVIEVREVLRWWLDGVGLRTIAARAGVDRKTARRYVEAAQAAGLSRDAGQSALCDELIGAVIAAVRPTRPNGHGAAWDLVAARKKEISDLGEGRVVGREDRGAADPVRHDSAVSDVAPVRVRGVWLPGPRNVDAGVGRR